MSHFPTLRLNTTRRLLERGRTPDESCGRMLDELRSGAFMPMLRRRRRVSKTQRIDELFAGGIPAAMVLTDEQSAKIRRQAE